MRPQLRPGIPPKHQRRWRWAYRLYLQRFDKNDKNFVWKLTRQIQNFQQKLTWQHKLDLWIHRLNHETKGTIYTRKNPAMCWKSSGGKNGKRYLKTIAVKGLLWASGLPKDGKTSTMQCLLGQMLSRTSLQGKRSCGKNFGPETKTWKYRKSLVSAG